MHGEYSWNYFVGAKSCCKKKKNMSTIGKWNVGKEESLCFNSKTR